MFILCCSSLGNALFILFIVALVTRCLLFMLVASGATLTFDDVKKTDSGRYVCYTENVVGLTSGSVTLDVQCEYPWHSLLYTS